MTENLNAMTNQKIHVDEDLYGNRITVKGDTIRLKLSSESRSRLVFTFHDDALYTVRTRGKHLHVKSDSYGFNDHILRTAVKSKYVMLLAISSAASRAFRLKRTVLAPAIDVFPTN